MDNYTSFDAEDPTPGRADSLSSANVFPWPPSPAESPVQAFIDSWREATFHPRAFFAEMPKETTLGPSLLYFLILGIITAAIGLFWAMVLPKPNIDSGALPSAFSVLHSVSPVVGFLLSPVIQIMALFIGAAITQVMLLILVPQRGPYSRTVRVYCFSHSPGLFVVIPYIGTLIAGIWSIVIAIIGLREAHETTTGRAAAVVLLPTLLLFIAFMIIVAVLVAGALMMVK
jgi:hypothetical protein